MFAQLATPAFIVSVLGSVVVLFIGMWLPGASAASAASDSDNGRRLRV